MDHAYWLTSTRDIHREQGKCQYLFLPEFVGKRPLRCCYCLRSLGYWRKYTQGNRCGKPLENVFRWIHHVYVWINLWTKRYRMEVREIGLKSLKPEIGVEKFDPLLLSLYLRRCRCCAMRLGLLSGRQWRVIFRNPTFRIHQNSEPLGWFVAFKGDFYNHRYRHW